MPLYSEPVRREPNSHGKLRLVTVLGHLPGAVGRGFDGDGTPPRRGLNEELGRRRVWWLPEPLPMPRPDGVRTLSEQAYTALESTREATKPEPPPPPEPRRDLEADLDAALARIDALEGGAGVRP